MELRETQHAQKANAADLIMGAILQRVERLQQSKASPRLSNTCQYQILFYLTTFGLNFNVEV